MSQFFTMPEKQEATLRLLSNTNSLRSLCSLLNARQIKTIADRFLHLHEQKVQQELEEEQQLRAKIAKVEEARVLLDSMGLSLEDLKPEGRLHNQTKPRKAMPKGIYGYEDTQGNYVEVEVLRAGKAGGEFAAYLKRTGKRKKDCYIRPVE